MKYRIFITLCVLLVSFSPAFGVKAQGNFDTKTVVQIRIWDNQAEQYVSSGSGVSIGGGAILTNYHVAEDLINNPDRYNAVVCIQKTAGLDCSYLAHAYYRLGLLTPQYPTYVQELDLAVIYLNYKYIDGEWKSLMKLPLDQWNDMNVVDLSIYGYEMEGIEEGDEVQTLGFPAYSGDVLTYSWGAVQDFRYDLYPMEGFYGVNAIGITAPIGHGSSGGAALDANGSLIGLTSLCSIGIDNEEVCDHGYIIPVAAINWWWEQVLGNKVSDWFGYTSDAIPEDVGKSALCMVEGKQYDEASDQCRCEEGYGENISGECVLLTPSRSSYECSWPNEMINGTCLNIYSYCKSTYGEVSKPNGIHRDGLPVCFCDDDTYRENTVCSQETTVSESVEETPANQTTIKSDASLSEHLKGRILLQVESHGEAWYVDPITEKRYYMKDGPTAYQMMRSFGLGVSEADYAKIDTGDVMIKRRLSGRIILRVEEHGEAYWIDPQDLSVRYLRNGDEAYRIMRLYSLGITNNDLADMTIGDIKNGT